MTSQYCTGCRNASMLTEETYCHKCYGNLYERLELLKVEREALTKVTAELLQKINKCEAEIASMKQGSLWGET